MLLGQNLGHIHVACLFIVFLIFVWLSLVDHQRNTIIKYFGHQRLLFVSACSKSLNKNKEIFIFTYFSDVNIKEYFFNAELKIPWQQFLFFPSFRDTFFKRLKQLFCMHSQWCGPQLAVVWTSTRSGVDLNRFINKLKPFSSHHASLATHVIWCIKSRTLLFIHLSPVVSFSKYVCQNMPPWSWKLACFITCTYFSKHRLLYICHCAFKCFPTMISIMTFSSKAIPHQSSRERFSNI